MRAPAGVCFAVVLSVGAKAAEIRGEGLCSMSTVNLGSDGREKFPEVAGKADIWECGRSTGKEKPLVVVVTGAAANTMRGNYTALARSLAVQGSVVAVVDRFDLDKAPYNLASPLTVERAIDAAGVKGEVYLWGHSLGAQVVLATLAGTCGDFCSEPADVTTNPKRSIGYGVSPPPAGISNAGKAFLAFDGANDSLDQGGTFTLSTIPALKEGAVAIEANDLEHMSPVDGPYTRVGDTPSSAPWPFQMHRVVAISSAFFEAPDDNDDICSLLDDADPRGSFSFCLVISQ